jgi:hypothetical protein
MSWVIEPELLGGIKLLEGDINCNWNDCKKQDTNVLSIIITQINNIKLQLIVFSRHRLECTSAKRWQSYVTMQFKTKCTFHMGKPEAHKD